MNRTIDLLCPEHVALIIDEGWPGPNAMRGQADRCRRCHRAYNAPGRPGEFRLLPDLCDDEYSYVTAIHEAAHAVIGVLVGHDIIRVRVGRKDGEDKYGSYGSDGGCDVGPYNLPVIDHLAMCWAGQEAQILWLHDSDLADDANQIDVRYGGWHDRAEILDYADRCGAPTDCGRDFCLDLLDKQWTTVLEIADELANVGELDGAAVLDFMGMVV